MKIYINHRRSCEFCCDFQECLRSSSFVLQILLDHRLRTSQVLKTCRDYQRFWWTRNTSQYMPFQFSISWPLKSRFRKLQTFHVGCASNQTVMRSKNTQTWLEMFQRIPMGIRWVNGCVIEPWRAVYQGMTLRTSDMQWVSRKSQRLLVFQMGCDRTRI